MIWPFCAYDDDDDDNNNNNNEDDRTDYFTLCACMQGNYSVVFTNVHGKRSSAMKVKYSEFFQNELFLARNIHDLR